jgi:hypothetical protein
MVKLSNAEIDMLFHRTSNPTTVSGQMEGAGMAQPLKIKKPYKPRVKGGNINPAVLVPSVGPSQGASNSNLEPNQTNDTRLEAVPRQRKARTRTLKRDQKVNGPMAGSGFKEFAEGVKEGFTGTIKAVAPTVLDIAAAVVPVAQPARRAIKKVTGLGVNTNYNEPRGADGIQAPEKKPLRQELGIKGAGTNPKWIDFVKAIRETSPNLKLNEALKIGSAMKKDKKNKLSDITQQSVATYANMLGL